MTRAIQANDFFDRIAERQQTALGSVVLGNDRGSEHTCPVCHKPEYMAGRHGYCSSCKPKPPEPKPAKRLTRNRRADRMPTREYKLWSKADVKMLRDNAHLGGHAVAELLGRSTDTVKGFAGSNHISLRKRPAPEAPTTEASADITTTTTPNDTLAFTLPAEPFPDAPTPDSEAGDTTTLTAPRLAMPTISSVFPHTPKVDPNAIDYSEADPLAPYRTNGHAGGTIALPPETKQEKDYRLNRWPVETTTSLPAAGEVGGSHECDTVCDECPAACLSEFLGVRSRRTVVTLKSTPTSIVADHRIELIETRLRLICATLEASSFRVPASARESIEGNVDRIRELIAEAV